MKSSVRIQVVFTSNTTTEKLLKGMSTLYNAEYDMKLDDGLALLSKEFDEIPSEIPFFEGATTFVTRFVDGWPEQEVYHTSKGWVTTGGFDPIPELMQLPPHPAGWEKV